MGTVFYIGVEASEGYTHLVGVVSEGKNSFATQSHAEGYRAMLMTRGYALFIISGLASKV